MVKIIVYSDIRIYCEGISQILSSLDTIEVVGAENSLDGAVSQVERTAPDVILLDMTMLGSNDLAKQFTQHFPRIKIVALAVPEDETNVIECAEAGISGYVAREATIDDLINTVISTQRGEFCCPPKIATLLFNKMQYLARQAKQNYFAVPDQQQQTALSELTRREKQILDLMADGLSNKQISTALVIEVSTVKNHVHNVLVKLGVNSRVQAVNMLTNTMQHKASRSFGLERRQEIYP